MYSNVVYGDSNSVLFINVSIFQNVLLRQGSTVCSNITILQGGDTALDKARAMNHSDVVNLLQQVNHS